MSTKTSTIKRIALVAVAALGFGMLSGVAVNAVAPDVTTTFNQTTANPGGSNFPAAAGTWVTVPVTITGNVTNPSTFLISGGVETEWDFTQTGGPALTASATSGNGSETLSVTNTNTGAQVATFDLRVRVTSGTVGTVRTITSNDAAFGTSGVLTLSYIAVVNTDGLVSLVSATNPTTGSTTGSLVANSTITIATPGYSYTVNNTPKVGTGANGTFQHDLVATVAGGTFTSAQFNAPTTGALTAVAPAVSATVTVARSFPNTTTLRTAVTGNSVSGSTVVTTGATSFSFVPTAAGTYTVTFSGAGLTSTVVSIVVATDPNSIPWRPVVSAPDATDPAVPTSFTSMTVNNVITSSTDYTVIQAVRDTASLSGDGNFRYVKVTGSTIKNAATGAGAAPMTLDGSFDSATQIAMPQDGNLYQTSGNQIWINTATVGKVTVEFLEQTTDSVTGFKSTKLLQTITINSVAAAALDPVKSTSIIRANANKVNATDGVASSCQVSATQLCGNTFLDLVTEKDEVVIAPRKIIGVSTTTDAVATIKVRLLDSAGIGVTDAVLPSVGAIVDGPGLVSISASAYGTSLTSTPGRNLSLTKAPANVFYINIFADGNAGNSKISVLVGGGVWKTETLSFYGDATTVKAVQGRYVLPEGTVTSTSALSFSYGCAGLTCDGSTVDLSVATTLAVTDALGTPVPYRTFTAATSDAGVLLGVATATAGDAAVPHLGVHHFKVTVPYATTATSGKSAALTYTTGTGATAVSSNALTFSLGGKATAVKLSLSGKNGIGEMNTMSFTATDALKNKAYDADHAAALTSNVVINTAVNSDQLLFSAAGDIVSVWNGTGTVDFYNPIVPTNLVIGGKVGGAAVSATASINNAAADAAAAAAKAQAEKDAAAALAAIQEANDAAAEAIDAANAATDAANLAAEAADAATVAAEEARDAADAATAAIEELATQVASLIAALQAQIKTLANTVAKIAKKVKA
jgi:hypothetical protein